MSFAMFDISSNNPHPIDFKAAKHAGYLGVMIKATEGESYFNPCLTTDAQEAHAAGLHIGYYHFARPGESAPEVQANNFWQHVKRLPRDLGLSLDLEVAETIPFAGLDRFAIAFLDCLPTEVKVRTLYANPSFAANLPAATRKYPLWLASWGLRPRRKVWAWQQGQGDVPGVRGKTDIGIYYG